MASKITYKEFPAIEVPALLQDDQHWRDESWGNDICAHSLYTGKLIDPNENRPVELWAWVDYDDIGMRESGGSKYFVTVEDKEFGFIEAYGMGASTDDLDVFKQWINAMLKKYGAEYQIP